MPGPLRNLCLLSLWAVSALAGERPNIVLFMTDDMGIECVGAYGAQDYVTPNLDRLAADGIQFNHCYSQPLCTPSRVKIMTGRYNFRNYTAFKHLDPTQKTFGHVARSAGYATAVTGKWQLDGSVRDHFGQKFGFDTYCLWYLNEDSFGPRYLDPVLIRDGGRVDGSGKYGPDVCNEFALDFIDRNRTNRFFLYYPMILPHYPFVPTPNSSDWDPGVTEEQIEANDRRLSRKERKARKKRHFVDMVQYADALVGRVLAKLDALKPANDTIVMFTSDNGTMRGLVSTWHDADYAGGKGRLDNTGTHVPMIVRWNDRIEPGRKTDALVDFSDFMATIIELTGGRLSADYAIDGRSLVPCLTRDPTYRPRAYTYCHYDPKWGTPELGRWARTQTTKIYGDGGPVYDISQDYFESSPLGKNTDSVEIGLLQEALNTMQRQGSQLPLHLQREGFQKGNAPAASPR